MNYTQLTPDISQSLSSGLQTGIRLGEIGRNQAEQERRQRANQVVGGILAQGNITGRQLAQLPEMQELYKYDPDAAMQLAEYVDKRDMAGLERLRYNNQRQSELIYPLAAISDPNEQKLEAIRQAQVLAKSQDPTERETAQELLDIANLPPDARKARFAQAAVQSKAGDKVVELLFGGGESASKRGVQFLPTSQGYMVGDLSTGQIRSPGAAYMPATADVNLQGNLARTTAAAGAEGKTSEERAQIFIDQGIAAQSGLKDINRARELLNDIETSGYQAAKNKAAQWFGIQSEDQGEFSNLLGQQTLAALKTTFGGNPTEGERAILMELQGSLANSKGVNKRILDRAARAYEAKVRRGKKFADERGEDWGVLTGEFGDQQSEPAPATAPQQGGVKFLGFE